MIYDDTWLWIVIVGFIMAFILAFGLGANDVANSFGTSVGAKVLTIRQACILGTIFEMAGAILVGAKVSNTIRKGIISPDIYTNGTEETFLVGNLSALTGSCIWLILATFFSLPVSGTHSIVGATLGFSIVVNGIKGIGWIKLAMIGASWFISPVLSGLVSCGLFWIIDILILRKEKPLDNGLRLLPVFYAVTLAVNLFSIFYKGSELLHFHKIPLYGTMILTFGPAILIAILVRIFVAPRQRRKIEALCEELKRKEEEDGLVSTPLSVKRNVSDILGQEVEVHKTPDDSQFAIENEESNKMLEETKSVDTETAGISAAQLLTISTQDSYTLEHTTLKTEGDKDNSEVDTSENTDTDTTPEKEQAGRDLARQLVQDKPETAGLFTFLQVLTAVFGSFAHGGNDVSNAIGPLVALWVTAITGSSAQKVPVPIWVLVYGGLGISVGLWVWGRRVMKTMGEDLTKITPSSGFCIEVGSALTVIVASNVGIPISTTHCKVGSVVCVGRIRSRGTVDWKLFRNIILAWCITLPVSGGLSALAMLGFRAIAHAT